MMEQTLTETVEAGRKHAFLVIYCYKLLNLNKDADKKEIRDSYTRKSKELIQSDKSEDEKAESEEKLKVARDSILEFRELLKSSSKNIRRDWEDYFNAHEIYMKESPVSYALMETDIDELYKSLNSHIAFSPLKYPSHAQNPIDWSSVRRNIDFYVFVIIGIPILILFWNLHAVLGLLGIVVYLFTIKKLWGDNF